MSLILEALRKLERDKAAPDRGFVVMTASAWPAGGTRRGTLVVGAVALGTAILGLAIWAATRASGPVNTVSNGGPPSTAAGPAAIPPATVPRIDLPAAAVATPRSDSALAPASVAPPPGSLAPEEVAVLPAVSTAPAAPKARELRLQAISQRDGRPIALLNDRLVREGESFEGVRIVAIRADEVEVEVDGRRTVLKF